MDLRRGVRLRLHRTDRFGPDRPLLGRDEERRRRGVDDAAVGHHGGRVDRRESLREVDGEHGQHPEARELRRVAHVAAADERARSLLAEPVGREPRGDARASDNRLVLRGCGGERRRRAGRRRDVRQLDRHLRRGDDADDAADHARRDVGAVERQRLHDFEMRRVGDVDLGQHRVRGLRPDHVCRHRGQRLDPVAAARKDEQARAGEEELMAPAVVEPERVEELRLRAADVDGV